MSIKINITPEKLFIDFYQSKDFEVEYLFYGVIFQIRIKLSEKGLKQLRNGLKPYKKNYIFQWEFNKIKEDHFILEASFTSNQLVSLCFYPKEESTLILGNKLAESLKTEISKPL